MEIWKDIPGFEGRYQVSDLGRVRSLDAFHLCASKYGQVFRRFRSGKVLKCGPHTSGYVCVRLADGTGGLTAHLVHRLVATTFFGPQPSSVDVNHINLDKKDNRVANLEWCSRSENMRHAIVMGRKPGRSYAVIGTPLDGGPERKFKSQIEAEIALSGAQSAAVHHCLVGKKKSAYGFTWRRA